MNLRREGSSSGSANIPWKITTHLKFVIYKTKNLNWIISDCPVCSKPVSKDVEISRRERIKM
jgi:hypothetical protein